MCIQHGVASWISQIVSASLCWKALHILKEHRMEYIYNYIISPTALQASLLAMGFQPKTGAGVIAIESTKLEF